MNILCFEFEILNLKKKFSIEDYLKRQPTLNKNMRLLLVDWIVEVQQQLEFNHEVLYLSVKLLDLYLNSKQIEKEKLQVLGGAAMFIACKYEVSKLLSSSVCACVCMCVLSLTLLGLLLRNVYHRLSTTLFLSATMPTIAMNLHEWKSIYCIQ
jgi:hypothetical protein